MLLSKPIIFSPTWQKEKITQAANCSQSKACMSGFSSLFKTKPSLCSCPLCTGCACKSGDCLSFFEDIHMAQRFNIMTTTPSWEHPGRGGIVFFLFFFIGVKLRGYKRKAKRVTLCLQTLEEDILNM